MPEDQFKRKLTAILSADVAGYSRLMGEDEMATVSTMKSHRNLIAEKIRAFKGRVVDSPGDNILAEFGSIVDAVTCAVEIQNGITEKNQELPENRKMLFRIGVNLGDVVQDEDRIYGDGVNIAARIESMADLGGVSISGTAFDSVRNKLKFGFEFQGEHQVKNIAHAVRVYRVLTDPADSGKLIGEAKAHRSIMPKTMLAVSMVIFLLGATYFYLAHMPSNESATTKQTTPEQISKPSIAVLPFANMSDDPQQEYFSDGLTDDLITDLSKVSGLMVISRNSTFTYKGKPVQIKNVAQDLGVKYVLEGSVR
jgi:adenylate cyclase